MAHGPPHFGTEITAPLQEGFARQQEEEAKQKEIEDRRSCIARGGKWDKVTKTCDLDLKLAPTKEAQEPPKVTPSGPELFHDPETGKVTGVTLPDGRSFFGLNTDEIDDIINRDKAEKARATGLPSVGTAQAEADRAFRIQEQIAQIGQLGTLDPAIQADINISQAVTAGLARVIPGLAAGAAGGALVGGAATAGVAAIPGAIIGAGLGAVTGFTSGILSNIKEQQSGELRAAREELSTGLRSMRQLAMLASQDPSNADIYISQYNAALTRIYQSRRQTQAEVTGDLNAFMEDGREQLAAFDVFLQEDGLADIYGQKLAISLNSGVTLSINGEDLILE